MFELYYTEEDGSIVNESYMGNRRTKNIIGQVPPNIGRNTGDPYEYGEDQVPAEIDTIISNAEKGTKELLAAGIHASNAVIDQSDSQILNEQLTNWYEGQSDEGKAELDKNEVYQAATGKVNTEEQEDEVQADIGEEEDSEISKDDDLSVDQYGVPYDNMSPKDRREAQERQRLLGTLKKRYGYDTIDGAMRALINEENPKDVLNWLQDYAFAYKMNPNNETDFSIEGSTIGINRNDWAEYTLKKLQDEAYIVKQQEAMGQGVTGQTSVDYSGIDYSSIPSPSGTSPYQAAGFGSIYQNFIDRNFMGNPMQRSFAAHKEDEVYADFLVSGEGDLAGDVNPFAEFMQDYKPSSAGTMLGSVKNIISSLRKDPDASRTEQELFWEERFGSINQYGNSSAESQQNQQILASAPILKDTPFVLRGETKNILDRLYNRWLTNPNTNPDESWLEFVDRNNYFGMISEQPQIAEESLEYSEREKEKEVAPTSRGEGEYL